MPRSQVLPLQPPLPMHLLQHQVEQQPAQHHQNLQQQALLLLEALVMLWQWMWYRVVAVVLPLLALQQQGVMPSLLLLRSGRT
jgi:hypothetical protein